MLRSAKLEQTQSTPEARGRRENIFRLFRIGTGLRIGFPQGEFAPPISKTSDCKLWDFE